MNAERRPSLTWQLLKTLSGKNLPQLGKNKEQSKKKQKKTYFPLNKNSESAWNFKLWKKFFHVCHVVSYG